MVLFLSIGTGRTVLLLGLLSVLTAFMATPVVAYPFQRHVKAASARYGVEEALIRAVIRAESNYHQYAVSHKGALGLMQLLITTARRYEPLVSRFQLQEEASLNIDIGTRHLRDLDRRVQRYYPHLRGLERVRLIAAAYNAGWSRVIAAGGRIPRILETQRYCHRVVRYYRAFGGKRKSLPQANKSVTTSTSNQPLPSSKPTRSPVPGQLPFDITRETVKVVGVLSVLFLGHALMGWSHLTLIERWLREGLP